VTRPASSAPTLTLFDLLDVTDALPFPPPGQGLAMKFEPDDDFGDSVDTRGLDAVTAGVLVLAGGWCSRREPGFIRTEVLATIDPDWERAAGVLVRRGIWRKLQDGYQFADCRRWGLDGTPQAGPAPALRDARAARPAAGAQAALRKALHRDPALRDALRARDAGRCRYCLAPVRWGAGRASDSGTWALIDMDGTMDMGNIVVACVRCAGARRRGEHLVLAAGSVPAGNASAVNGNATGSVPVSVPAGQKRSGKRSSRAGLIDDLDHQSRVKSKSPARAGNASGQVKQFSTSVPAGGPGDGAAAQKRSGPGDAPGNASRHRNASRTATGAVAVELCQRAGRVVTDDEALHAIAILDKRAHDAGTTPGGAAYYRACVRNEADHRNLLPREPTLQEILSHPDWQPPRPDAHPYELDPATGACACSWPRGNARHASAEARTA
jgi:hypothetical protein